MWSYMEYCVVDPPGVEGMRCMLLFRIPSSTVRTYMEKFLYRLWDRELLVI